MKITVRSSAETKKHKLFVRNRSDDRKHENVVDTESTAPERADPTVYEEVSDEKESQQSTPVEDVGVLPGPKESDEEELPVVFPGKPVVDDVAAATDSEKITGDSVFKVEKKAVSKADSSAENTVEDMYFESEDFSINATFVFICVGVSVLFGVLGFILSDNVVNMLSALGVV